MELLVLITIGKDAFFTVNARPSVFSLAILLVKTYNLRWANLLATLIAEGSSAEFCLITDRHELIVGFVSQKCCVFNRLPVDLNIDCLKVLQLFDPINQSLEKLHPLDLSQEHQQQLIPHLCLIWVLEIRRSLRQLYLELKQVEYLICEKVLKALAELIDTIHLQFVNCLGCDGELFVVVDA